MAENLYVNAHASDVEEMELGTDTEVCFFCGAACSDVASAITRCSGAEAFAVASEVTDKHGLLWTEASSSFVIEKAKGSGPDETVVEEKSVSIKVRMAMNVFARVKVQFRYENESTFNKHILRTCHQKHGCDSQHVVTTTFVL